MIDLPPNASQVAADIDNSINRVAWGFMIAGAIVAIIGLTWATRTALFIRRAIKVPGEIIAISETVGTRGGREDPFEGTIYHLIFAFTDLTGVRHEVRSSRAAKRTAFNTGDKV